MLAMRSDFQLLDGKLVARKLRDAFASRIDRLRELGIVPGLAVILVGDDPASRVYVRNKERAFQKLGLVSDVYHLDSNASQERILELIEELNENQKYHGILVQLPLPSHLNEFEIIERISPDKDADGIHPCNIGLMATGQDCPLPCTPHGILKILEHYGLEVEGRHVVIVGRSNIVGKPLALLLMQKRSPGNATVTICHSRTKNLKEITLSADILVVAIGKPEYIDESYVKNGAVVIDVGTNRIEDSSVQNGYRLVGDVKFSSVKEKVRAITPVPGGVGPMTITMLIYNTIYLAEKTAALPK